jgi:hypothetical protein
MKSSSLKDLSCIFLKLAEDYRELLKKRLERDSTISLQERVLMNNALIPIRLPILDKATGKYKETSFLGNGKFSEAFLVDYKGRQAVAKITSVVSDIKMTQHLSKIKSQMGELGKHIMDVFAVITDADTGLTICIVEKLEPLNSQVMNSLWSSKESVDSNVGTAVYEEGADISAAPRNVGAIKQPGVLNRLIDLALRDFSPEVTKRALPTLRKWLENVNFSKPKTMDEMNKFLWSISSTAEKIIKDSLAGLFPEETEESIESEAHIMWESLQSILGTHFEGGNMPVFDYDKERVEMVSSLPEVKSLMRALKLLKNSGIKWADMHSGNIMQRPGTGDLVICDPGWFEIEKSV